MSIDHTDNQVSPVELQHQAASLLLYQSVLSTEIGVAFVELLQAIAQLQQDRGSSIECLRAYGSWFNLLAATNQSWQAYLVQQILYSDNPFTKQAQQFELAVLPLSLVAAARQDLQALQQLYTCSTTQISQWIQDALPVPLTLTAWQAPNEITTWHDGDWAESIEQLAAHYRQFGTGLFAQYRALRWHSGKLMGITCPDSIKISDLVGYEMPREMLLKNTEALLAGHSALHVLLYGSRGSGKSSLVKSLLTQYGDRGLRLIEVAKSELIDLPVIVDRLRQIPQKFIIFVDDLSFEADEDAYKALKVVLEGNLTARPQNVVIYATSNRRHLIREFHGDRPRPSAGDEIHAWDTVQEKLSLSDRFGLTLTFEPADQDTYLQIVRHLATQAQLKVSIELDQQSLQWATRHNGRSGRTARQFIDFLQADLATAATH